MFLDNNLPPEFEIADNSAKTLLAEIVKSISPVSRDVTFSSTDNWYADKERAGKIYFIKEGQVAHKVYGKLLHYYNEGDLFGVDNLYTPADSKLACEFAIVVDVYETEDFFNKVNSNPKLARKWAEYSAQQLKLYSILLSFFVNDYSGYIPEVRLYVAGDVIITEGESSEEIYSMVEGKADVFVKGQQVGKVTQDEVFGTVAGLTNKPRNSTIIAHTDCMVAVLPKENFKYLLYTQPDTVVKLVEDLARALDSVTEKLKAGSTATSTASGSFPSIKSGSFPTQNR
ncbi:MAG: cyclic nucleotide-binding domain-containing protein [Proteobacteria bacterium]|nr:cyclic nucleotide-binding domain-containing protein [Pseudomonadota bacterium]